MTLEDEDFKRLFFRGWKLPALKVFDLANQHPSHDIMQCSNLTCLHLNLGLNEMPGWGNSSRCSTQSFSGYLRVFVHSKTLEELSVKLLHVLELSEATFLETVHLASVRKLTFDVEGVYPQHLVHLAEKLRFSGLKHMDLRIEMYHGNFEKWLAPFRDDSNYGGDNLTHMSLAVWILKRGCAEIDQFLLYYRGLRYLNLRGNFILPDMNLGTILETLQIEDSDRIDRSFLDTISSTPIITPGVFSSPSETSNLSIVPLLMTELSKAICSLGTS